jgi:hypothetical protein
MHSIVKIETRNNICESWINVCRDNTISWAKIFVCRILVVNRGGILEHQEIRNN